MAKGKFIGVVGDLDWVQLKNFLLVRLINADTEEKFNELLSTLYASMGTKEDMAKKRKILGIKPFTKEDLEKMK